MENGILNIHRTGISNIFLSGLFNIAPRKGFHSHAVLLISLVSASPLLPHFKLAILDDKSKLSSLQGKPFLGFPPFPVSCFR
jgi:hypothetical protein